MTTRTDLPYCLEVARGYVADPTEWNPPWPDQMAVLLAEREAMLAILRDVAVALDMADPESDNFADCAGDVLQHLLENAGPDLMRLFLGLGEELDGSGPEATGNPIPSTPTVGD